MELGEGGSSADAPGAIDAAQLSYPTALNSAEARSFSRPKEANPPSSSSSARRKAGKAPVAKGPSGKAVAKSPRAAAAPASLPSAAKAGSLLNEVPPVAEPAEAPRDEFAAAMDVTDDAGGADAMAADAMAADATTDDADGAKGSAEVPHFTQAQWEALRPAPSSPRRPQSARAAPKPHASPRGGGGGLGSSSALGGSARGVPFDSRPPLGSCLGVIHSQSMIMTPRRPKSDPVSLHAKRMSQWQSDSYLSLTTRRTGPPIDMSPAPRTVKLAKRTVNNYVVPTAKRRDELVWQTRQRLRQADPDAGGGAGGAATGKRMVPNSFVPATEKRRDDLRWAVRTEMAWIR